MLIQIQIHMYVDTAHVFIIHQSHVRHKKQLTLSRFELPALPTCQASAVKLP